MGFKELAILLSVLFSSLQVQLSHKTARVNLIKVLALMVFQEQKVLLVAFLFFFSDSSPLKQLRA